MSTGHCVCTSPKIQTNEKTEKPKWENGRDWKTDKRTGKLCQTNLCCFLDLYLQIQQQKQKQEKKKQRRQRRANESEENDAETNEDVWFDNMDTLDFVLVGENENEEGTTKGKHLRRKQEMHKEKSKSV